MNDKTIQALNETFDGRYGPSGAFRRERGLPTGDDALALAQKRIAELECSLATVSQALAESRRESLAEARHWNIPAVLTQEHKKGGD